MTYDSATDDTFVVHKRDHKIHFVASNNGLYYHDCNNRQISLINLVEENMEGYSQQQIERAKKVKDVYVMIGYPTITDFKATLQKNMLMNCPYTVEDIDNATNIFGPDIHVLKGKTTRKQPISVRMDYVAVPHKIKTLHHNITLAIDIFFVNNLPFFITVSRHIKFGTVQYMERRNADAIKYALKTL